MSVRAMGLSAAAAMLATLLLFSGAGGAGPEAEDRIAVCGQGLLVPTGLALEDLDGDGNADLIAAFSHPAMVRACLGDGEGGFRPAGEAPGGGPEGGLAVGFRGEGRTPIIAAASGRGGTLTLLTWSAAEGLVVERGAIPAGKGPSHVTIGYWDEREEDPFVAISNQGSHEVTIVGRTESDRPAVTTFDLKRSWRPAPAPTSIVAADLDGDGRKDDLAVTNRKYDTVSLLYGEEPNRFEWREEDFRTGRQPSSVDAGWIGEEKRPILAVANALAQNVTVYVSDEAEKGGFRELARLHAGQRPESVSIAQVGELGIPIVAVGAETDGRFTAYLLEWDGTSNRIAIHDDLGAVQAVEAACLVGVGKPFVAVGGRKLYGFSLYAEE